MVMDHFRPQVIQDNPIGAGLDTFRDSFNATCQRLGISPSTEILSELEERGNKNLLLW